MAGRLKRLFGTVILVAFVVVYALAALGVGNVIVASKSEAVQMMYFAVAGLAWVPPAGLLIWWMYRDSRRS